jgi:hypothetical protein
MTDPTGQINAIKPSRPYAAQFEENEAFVMDHTNFNEVLRIDSTNISKSVINLKNNDGAISESFQIMATSKREPNFTDFTSKEWNNILNDPANAYDHTLTATLAAGSNGRTYRAFKNPWAWVCVLVKGASGTPTIAVYHKGTG